MPSVNVDIADNAPCTVTGTNAEAEGTFPFSDSDPTTITGDRDGGNGGGRGPIPPSNLGGLILMFNDINRPHARNNSDQVFRVDETLSV
jgi:hypothetical protein